jgi:hypothetical protein
VTRKPVKLLVCLSLLSIVALSAFAWGYNGTGAPSGPGIQGEALSADPTVHSLPPLRSEEKTLKPQRIAPQHSQSRKNPNQYRSRPSVTIAAPRYEAPSRTYATRGLVSYGGSAAAAPSAAPWPVQASAAASPGGGMCGPVGGANLGYSPCVPILPRVGCKQFQADARLWYAQLNSSTVQWGNIPGGWLAPELDLHTNLGLRRHEYVPEFVARCQLRQNWGLRYTFMPLHYRDNFTNWTPFWFGNLLWPAGAPMLTEWDRNLHNWELVYSWFQAPHAVSSVFAGFRLYDDKLKVSYPLLAPVGYTRTRSQNMHLATAGMSIDRVVARVGGCATASMHCQWSIQFLEGHLGWDAYGVGRISVPMSQGRYGYMEAGWKWLVLDRGQLSNMDKTSLDGAIASVGLIF